MSLPVTIISLLVALACVLITWRTRQEAERRSRARVAALAAAIDPAARTQPVAVSMPAPIHPVARVAMGFGAVTAGVLVVVLAADVLGRPSAPEARPALLPALELLAMTSARQGQTLTVDGAVRNSSAVAMGQVAAEVLLLDRAGRRVASARAPLSAQALSPGAVARFHLEIPGNRAVERYRVSFRTDAGVVRHVDRRASADRGAAAAGGGRERL